MTKDDARAILTRVATIWRGNDMALETQNEWMLVLKPLNHGFADRAVNRLRDTLVFPPTVADFRKAYYEALAIGGGDKLALPPGDEMPTSLRERYGESQKDWVYCWRCDMALSLKERESSALTGYDQARGLYHRSCPKDGSAPLIPADERMARNEYFSRRDIAIGRHVTPMPYRG